jgi:carbon monoxide dehydrogenase subunit G
MASIRKEIQIEASAEQVWAALRDFAQSPVRLAQGFVTASQAEGDVRVVSFANGVVARERLIDMDEPGRRVVYAIVGGPLTHHNGSMQVFADGPGRCRLVWVADLLPNEMAGRIDGMMTEGSAAMQRTLSRSGAA